MNLRVFNVKRRPPCDSSVEAITPLSTHLVVVRVLVTKSLLCIVMMLVPGRAFLFNYVLVVSYDTKMLIICSGIMKLDTLRAPIGLNCWFGTLSVYVLVVLSIHFIAEIE